MRIGMTFNVRSDSRADLPGGIDDHGTHEANTGGQDSLSHSRYAQWADDDEEFDAPETVQALATVLEGLGHEVDLLGEGEPMLRRLLGGDRPELVLNFAEGSGAGRSREARVPAVLEMLDIPYTGSDPLTLAVTLDKDCAKRLVAASGVATPAWALFDGDESAVTESLLKVPMPWIVKPAFEGSSKGILTTNLIRDRSNASETLIELFEHYRQPVLIEEFIVGDELTVGLVGNRPPEVLGIMRVLPRNAAPGEPFIYSLEVKRDWERRVRYECPAKISAADDAAVRKAALTAWQALGCRDVSRIDFRLRDGVPYFLETNPLPGLSPKSGDLVLLAGMVGIDHAELVSRILNAAIERHESLAGALGFVGQVSMTPRLDVLVLHNTPALSPDHPDFASEAGVLESVTAVTAALHSAGHGSRALGIATLADLLAALPRLGQPDVVVNLFEGFAGVGRGEALVAGWIEALGHALTGSDPAALELVRDKARVKWLLRGAGLPTADFVLIAPDRPSPEAALAALLAGGPAIVKPAHEDASLGIGPESVVSDRAALDEQIAEVHARYGAVLVERFVAGREFNAAVVALPEPRLLPLAEIEFAAALSPRERLVTYAAKWNSGSAADLATAPRCPARVGERLGQRIEQAALAAFEATGCRDYARVDLRVADDESIYILEINGNPDIGPSAGFARALGAAGTAYDEFVDRLVRHAAGRRPKSASGV